MNRNVLKIIAVISMVIDHLGLFLLPQMTWMRALGRLAFPIFAFFIAEGLKHTKSVKKYVLNLSLFAFISQVPYALLLNFYNLNILFSFLIAIGVIYLISIFNKHNIISIVGLLLTFTVLILVEVLGVIDYGIWGIMLILIFYFVKDSQIKLSLSLVPLLLMSLERCFLFGFSFASLNQLFSFVAILILAFYNNQKGRANLKYLFYIFYPLHLSVIYLISNL